MNFKTILDKFKKIIILALPVAMVMYGLINYSNMADAAGEVGYVNGTGCYVRNAPGTNNASLDILNSGVNVTIIGQKQHTDGWLWYQIRYSNGSTTKEGWMRSDLITISTAPTSQITDQEFEARLNAEGFPESYKVYLRTLHAKHPNWVFKGVQTKCTWTEAIAGEIAITSRNLVPKSNISSWKSLANGSYDWASDSWYDIEPGWACASQALIEYCMDPRNFLTDDYKILMFAALNWNDAETMDGIRAILAGTAMTEAGGFPRIFYEAGQASGVSAYHLAARASQETAGGTSTSVSGQYKNYFNIKATAHDGLTPAQAGVEYAKSQGWDTAEKSIKGGATFIGSSYINRGQNTLYLQKFSVVRTEDLYWHQYMGNVLAPQQEAKLMAQQVKDKLGSAAESMVFNIPIYAGIPYTPAPLPTADGNPNSYLSNLTVNGYSLTPGFSSGVLSYDLIVSEKTSSVNVSATAMAGSSRVSGTGIVNLNPSGTTKVNINVTPSYGNTRTYTINITKGNVDNGVINTPQMTGDLNGDNEIDVMDLVLIKKQLVGLTNLSGDRYKAADVNHDGEVDVMDLVLIKKHLVGLYLIR